MKGPGMRIELDVSRIWRCPACSRTVGTRGTETSRRCFCSGNETWMDLVEPVRRPRDFSAVISEIHQGLESEGTSAADSVTEESAETETVEDTSTEDSFGEGVSAGKSTVAPPASSPPEPTREENSLPPTEEEPSTAERPDESSSRNETGPGEPPPHLEAS